MSVILLPDKWRRQPTGPIAVRPQWVGRGLTALYVLNARSWRINAVTGVLGGTASGTWHTYGPESITSSGIGTDHFDFAVGVTPATIVISYAMISGVVAWSNLRRDISEWSGLFDQSSTTSNDFAGSIGPLPTRGIGIPTYAFRWTEQNNYRGVADGGTVQVDTSTGAVPGNRSSISLGISKRGGVADNPSETRATLIAAFSQGLSDPEMQAITAAPWGELVRKQPRILYFTAPSGGGATIAGALESLTLSTFGATVGSARAVAAALESLALTTSAARVSSDRAITASVESISITTSPARIASDRAVAAATEQLTVTPATASVALVSGIAAGTEALSVTANPATVALAASIAATLEAITVTGLTATVSTSSNTNISAALESITVTVNPATVSRNTALAAALESLTVTPHAASIAVGQIVAAALESLTLTSYPAGIALDVAIAAQLEQINLTTLAAQVGLGTNVAALTEALTLTPHGATLTFAPSVGAATEYITLTTFAAVVGATEAALLSPGLEFTIPLSRMGYTIPVSRVHFTIPDEG